MSSFSRKKKHHPSNSAPANELASQSQATQQSQPIYPWSAHPLQFGQSPSPFIRSSHALSPTATATGELFLFGGYIHSSKSAINDLYTFSTRDFSTTLLKTSGQAPNPRYGHGAALTSTALLIWGGKTNFSGQKAENDGPDDSLYLLNLVSREWTSVVVNGPGPRGRFYHSVTLVGSKLFVFGGKTAVGRHVNDVWAFDLNCLNSNPRWESYEPTPGNEKPLARNAYVSVTTGDRIIIFGGRGEHYFNDTWSFNISTRKWTELQCTGSIPSPRSGHTAVLVNNVMYVFGGHTIDESYLGDLTALNLSTRRWTAFQDIGPSPCGRRFHAMASDGRRIFVLGGELLPAAQVDEAKLIHVLDTKLLIYPKSDSNTVIDSEASTEHLAKLVAPDASSEKGVARLEHARIADLERQLSETLTAQTERDQHIAQLTDQLAQNSALLKQAEANMAEAKKHAGLEQCEHQAKLSHDQALERGQTALQKATSRAAEANERSQRELAEVHAKLDARESELAAVCLRLTDAEDGWAKSKAEADTLRAGTQAAAGLVNMDVDRVISRLVERVRAVEAEMASLRGNEKSIEEMECRNEP